MACPGLSSDGFCRMGLGGNGVGWVKSSLLVLVRRSPLYCRWLFLTPLCLKSLCRRFAKVCLELSVGAGAGVVFFGVLGGCAVTWSSCRLGRQLETRFSISDEINRSHVLLTLSVRANCGQSRGSCARLR